MLRLAGALLLALAVAGVRAAPGTSFVSTYSKAKTTLGANGENPISKVVKMLQELSKENEGHMKEEQDMFDTYECWKKTVVSEKKKLISEASDRIEALAAYIDDIDSGRIEFSTEGADLTKEVQELRGEVEKSTNLRKKDKEDFEAAKEEMESTITALDGALKEMEAGTEGGFLQRAAQLAKALLPAGDAELVAKAATAQGTQLTQLRQPDYSKMNKKKTFNMKYVPRSDKIKNLLKDMLQTFKDNLEEAEDKEKDAKATFAKLKASKDSELESAENALAEMGGETAAREEAKQEALDETKALEEQIKTDEGFVEDVEKAYEEQKGLWYARKKLMTEEIMAIGNAISILTSDEARDTMSKTFDDKKVFNEDLKFLQIASRGSKITAAVRDLGKFARAHHSKRLSSLASHLEGEPDGVAGAAFKKVIGLMNDIKRDLNKESKEDAEKAKQCEKDLTEYTAHAQTSSNFIDEKTRFINRTKVEVAQLYDTVNNTVTAIEDEEWELNDATAERAKYHEAFVQEKATYVAAKDFIIKAKEALEKFYKDNGLSLVQAKKRAPSDIIVEAGKAPPPPPAVVIDDYEGSEGNKGIQSLMDDIASDVQKDTDELEQSESDAVADFEKMKADTEKSISDKMDLKAEKESEIASKLQEIADANQANTAEKEELTAVVKSLKTMEPDCDYVFTTRETRQRNRALEAVGVNTAIEKLDGDVKEVEYKEYEEAE